MSQLQDLRLEPLKLLIAPLILRGELKRLAGLSFPTVRTGSRLNVTKHAKLWLTLMIFFCKI